MKNTKQKINTLTRDFTSVTPKPKILVRRELMELCRMVVDEMLLEKKSLLADMAYTGGDLPKKYINFQRSNDLHYDSYNRCLSDIERRAEELLGK